MKNAELRYLTKSFINDKRVSLKPECPFNFKPEYFFCYTLVQLFHFCNPATILSMDVWKMILC